MQKKKTTRKRKTVSRVKKPVATVETNEESYYRVLGWKKKALEAKLFAVRNSPNKKARLRKEKILISRAHAIFSASVALLHMAASELSATASDWSSIKDDESYDKLRVKSYVESCIERVEVITEELDYLACMIDKYA